MKEWITVTTASRQAGVADRTIRHWIKQEKLVAKKEKGRWLIDPDTIQGAQVGKKAATGKDVAEESASLATDPSIAVPLERYEALITRVAQLEAENSEYRLMLEDKSKPWYRRVFRKRGTPGG